MEAEKHDQTPVTIHLDRRRPYHIGDDERNVIWVGPGEVVVPRWVAEHWGNEILGETKAPSADDPDDPEELLAVRQQQNLGDLDLSEAQMAALAEVGISDRASLIVLLQELGDHGLDGQPLITRSLVRSLRKTLAGADRAVAVSEIAAGTGDGGHGQELPASATEVH